MRQYGVVTAPDSNPAKQPSRPTIELIARYDRPGPRYTSYPTAISFHEGFTEADYRGRLAAADRIADEPLSFYAHLPFCRERCLFCGCNVIITPHPEVAQPYMARVIAENDLLAQALPNRRSISQLHWGGGTPTYYPAADLTRLFETVKKHFTFTPDAEIGIEVDPRVTSAEHVKTLAGLGFNRISAGVQDFAPEVQEAIHRIQSVEATRAIVDLARSEGMQSVNLDLIYGLPYQTAAGFARTLEQVIELRPERVAVYSFAFVPWIKGHMRHLPATSLPGPELKLELLALAFDAFIGAGYRAIGMDHFALPEDELARAADKGTLSRNFMGYTVQSARDMVGVGVSSIGDVQGAYVQNVKKLPTYYEAIDAGRFPVERGYALDADDRIRRHVITEIMCNARVVPSDVARRFTVDFDAYFAHERAELAKPGGLVDDGLVAFEKDAIVVTPLGAPFVRLVAMVFDRHLRTTMKDAKPVFSRTV
jgi:oxygen-independent coproporphyrinogen-3 oxidase